jgi:hypothetical protein
MTKYPDDPETLLTRMATAAALTSAGYPISPATLATKATRGGGPPYCFFAGRTLYRWGDALNWARARVEVRDSGACARDLGSDGGQGHALGEGSDA